MKNKIYLALLLGIFLLAFILRFYELGKVPNGFYQDESAIGYNAYSILQTGKDEYGKNFPLYFKSFGDYKLPVYIYATIPSILLFGMNEFAVRFPSSFFGFLTIIMSYFLVKEITKDKYLALLSTFLLAINPWSLHYNRATFEVSICQFLFTTGTWFLFKAFSRKWKGTFFLGTLCFIISAYAYNLTRLLSPILYVFVIGYLLFRKEKVSKNEVIVTGIISLVLLLPFILTLKSTGGVSSASGTLFYSSAVTQAPLFEFRTYITSVSPLFAKLVFNKFVLDIWQYIVNVASYFSVSFFFVSGSTHGNHGIGNVGEFYLFELPLVLIGIVHVIKEKSKWGNVLFGWAIITILIASLTRDIPQATRSFFLVFPIEILSAVGILYVYYWLSKQKRSMRYIVSTIVLCFILFNIIFYFSSYYIRFPLLYAKDWRLEDKDLSLYIVSHQNEYSKIIFDNKAGFIYTSLLFFTKYPPAEFQKSVKRAPDDPEGFSQVLSFGKYEFKDVDLSKDLQKGTLIVTTQDKVPTGMTTVDTFLYPKRPVAFAYQQQVIFYPVEEVAYVLLTKK